MADPTGMTGQDAILNDVSSPPPPPPPEEEGVMAATGSSALGGGAVGAVIGFVGPANGASIQEAGAAAVERGEYGLIMLILLGLIAGAIFGFVRSISYNLIIRNSSGVREFRRLYPLAKDVPYNELTYFYIHRKFQVFWDFLKENCCKEQIDKK